MQRELDVYSRLQYVDSPHLLRVRDVVRDEDFVALVTDFADGGDLRTAREARGRGGFTTREALAIAQQIGSGLAALHESGVVHRDLKPENVLACDGVWKLADFGIAKDLSRATPGKTFQNAGTYGYAAPEQFEGAVAHPSADIYSFGKLVTFLLTGLTDPDQLELTLGAWIKLIRRCLKMDPSARPAICDVVAYLQEM